MPSSTTSSSSSGSSPSSSSSSDSEAENDVASVTNGGDGGNVLGEDLNSAILALDPPSPFLLLHNSEKGRNDDGENDGENEDVGDFELPPTPTPNYDQEDSEEEEEMAPLHSPVSQVGK